MGGTSSISSSLLFHSLYCARRWLFPQALMSSDSTCWHTHDKLPVLECHIIDLDLLPVLPKPGGQDDAVCPLDKQLDLPLQIESFKMDPLPVARKPITMISLHWSHLIDYSWLFFAPSIITGIIVLVLLVPTLLPNLLHGDEGGVAHGFHSGKFSHCW